MRRRCDSIFNIVLYVNLGWMILLRWDLNNADDHFSFFFVCALR